MMSCGIDPCRPHLGAERPRPSLVVGVSGSPRKRSFSERLVREALAGARAEGVKTELIRLSDLSFGGCTGCAECECSSRCVIHDGLGAWFKKLASIDGLVVGTPLYFGSVTGQLKCFIDRHQALWSARSKRGAGRIGRGRFPGAIIIAGGSDARDQFVNAASVIRNFFVVVRAKPLRELFFGGLDSVMSETQKLRALDRAYDAGRALGRAARARVRHARVSAKEDEMGCGKCGSKKKKKK